MEMKVTKILKNQRGLTLIELLAVIVILAIIAAIAIPAIGNIIENSREKAAKSDIANVVAAANIYFTENSSATTFNITKSSAGVLSGSASTVTTSAKNETDYISSVGSIDEILVTKTTGGLVVKATGKIASQTYNVGTSGTYSSASGVALSSIKIDSPNITGDNFYIGTTD